MALLLVPYGSTIIIIYHSLLVPYGSTIIISYHSLLRNNMTQHCAPIVSKKKQCLPGTYSQAGSTICLPCNAGYRFVVSCNYLPYLGHTSLPSILLRMYTSLTFICSVVFIYISIPLNIYIYM